MKRVRGHSFLARVRVELPVGWAPFPGGETGALTDALARCVAALDCCDLNEQLSIPPDENLARWERGHLEVPGIQSVGIQSSRDQRADLDRQDHAHLWRRFRFEAAHQLPNVPVGHKCGRMHGHGFEVIVHAEQDLDREDMGIDLDHLGEVWTPLHRALHHVCRNDLPGLGDTDTASLALRLREAVLPRIEHIDRIDLLEIPGCGVLLCWGALDPALPI